jgi:hypothetical protein
MLRCMRWAVVLGWLLSMTASEARAQWAYGGWGWPGWDTAVTSDHPGGPAHFAMGAGVHNSDPRIPHELVVRYNTHVSDTFWHVCRLGPAAQNPHRRELNRELYERHIAQLRQEPTPAQIEDGSALNVALADLSDPKLGSSVQRGATAPVPAALIAEVPFESATERVTFMLDELREAVTWPRVFPAEQFGDAKKSFEDLVARMQREDEAADISARTLADARRFLDDLRTRLDARPLENADDRADAQKFIKAASALVQLLEKPDIHRAISALSKVKDTSLANLLGFLHAFNLRFGPAKTLKEKQTYHRLFEIIDRARDEIFAAAKRAPGAPAKNLDPSHVTDFYSKLRIPAHTQDPKRFPPELRDDSK